ncbi:serine/threonine protein kinase containing TPR domain [Tolypothrix sp. NIES-4075]|uniref:tetratricopeptide repeat protein n=1 Tax=Tolypothrix sp. NIES-4075 TaxID=2005459 RepID=UPI000B5C3AD3|nr:tetratricopeptide repeat protein [Tolypothrix sp. NIES-4075]GAX42577.1 serine/threonine protein kinase containing TPR domain [Tolypothrix sp. NIES-4075]
MISDIKGLYNAWGKQTIKKKILNNAPLLTTTEVHQPTTTQGIDIKGFQNSINSNGDLAAIAIVAGTVLAFGSTISLICKALHLGKSAAKIAEDTQQQKPQTVIASTTISGNQDIIAAYVKQAHTFNRQGDTNRAIAIFDNAIRVFPDDAYLYSQRANLRRQNLQDTNGAIEDYTQAINLHPENPLFYLWRSQVYYEIGDKFKAMADYNTAIRLAPEDTMYHCFKNG